MTEPANCGIEKPSDAANGEHRINDNSDLMRLLLARIYEATKNCRSGTTASQKKTEVDQAGELACDVYIPEIRVGVREGRFTVASPLSAILAFA